MVPSTKKDYGCGLSIPHYTYAHDKRGKANNSIRVKAEPKLKSLGKKPEFYTIILFTCHCCDLWVWVLHNHWVVYLLVGMCRYYWVYCVYHMLMDGRWGGVCFYHTIVDREEDYPCWGRINLARRKGWNTIRTKKIALL